MVNFEPLTFRSSQRRCSVKKDFLRNFAKYTGKHVCQSADLRPATLFKKQLWHRCFPGRFAKLLGTFFLQNTSRRLLLDVVLTPMTLDLYTVLDPNWNSN